jgi:Kef-type K+ transport system membrane component KefB
MTRELQLLLLLVIIIVACKVAGHISQRYLKQPAVFGKIIVGVLLGPSLLNLFQWPVFHNDATSLHEIVTMLANLGVLLLMFVAGLETDLAQIRKVGKPAFWTAVVGVIVPLGVGAGVARCLGIGWREAIFIGTILTATSVSISAQTLMELGKFRSKQGMTILGAAVIDDVLGIIVLSFVIAFGLPAGAEQGAGPVKFADMLTGLLAQSLHIHHAALLHIGVVIMLMGAFAGVILLVGRYATGWLAHAERLQASHMVTAAALTFMLLLALGAEYIGQVAAITGAYMAGITLARTPYHTDIEQAVHPFTFALFVPVFFMSIGLGANARELGTSLLFTLVIIAVAIGTKIVGCGFGAFFSGFTPRESLQVGIGMVSRGEVGLIVAQVGLAAGVIDTPIYASMVMMVLTTTVITPLLLRMAFTRQQAADVTEPVLQLGNVELEVT